MDVAIFGATCSPSSTQFVKNLAIKEKHYADDFIDSVHTVDEAVQLALHVKKVHEKVGFLIRH